MAMEMKMKMKMKMPHACGIIESDMAAMLRRCDVAMLTAIVGARLETGARLTFPFPSLPAFQSKIIMYALLNLNADICISMCTCVSVCICVYMLALPMAN